MSERETPRTDAAVFRVLSSLQSGTDEVVLAVHARDLEREIARLKEELAKATVARDKFQLWLDQMRDKADDAESRVTELEAKLAEEREASFNADRRADNHEIARQQERADRKRAEAKLAEVPPLADALADKALDLVDARDRWKARAERAEADALRWYKELSNRVAAELEPVPLEAREGYVSVPQSAIDWLMGMSDDFAPQEDGGGRFWWRAEFRRKAGLL